jgi:hypothetical protein
MLGCGDGRGGDDARTTDWVNPMRYQAGVMNEEAGLIFGLGKCIKRASRLTVDSDVDPGRYAAIVSEASLGNGFCITNSVSSDLLERPVDWWDVVSLRCRLFCRVSLRSALAVVES